MTLSPNLQSLFVNNVKRNHTIFRRIWNKISRTLTYLELTAIIHLNLDFKKILKKDNNKNKVFPSILYMINFLIFFHNPRLALFNYTTSFSRYSEPVNFLWRHVLNYKYWKLGTLTVRKRQYKGGWSLHKWIVVITFLFLS